MPTIRKLTWLCLMTLYVLPGWSQTFTVDVFTDTIFHINNAVQEVDVTFPDDGKLYSSVEVILTLEPPEGLDGDEWDRMGHIYMYDEHGDWLEVARFITPFWNPPWTWTMDITELQSLFHGEKRMGVWLQSWKDDGYQVSVSYRFTEGTPARMPIRVTNLWNGAAWGYGNPGKYRMEHFFTPLTARVGEHADQVLARISVTGHRFVDNSEDAAEFLRRGRTLVVNGGGNWWNELWQLCGSWPVQPQSPGTWFFDRSGWCPGDLVDPWITDITSQVVPGEDLVIEYIADEYINTGTALDAMEQTGSQLIELRDTNGFVVSPGDPFQVKALTTDALNGRSKIYRLYNFHGTAVNYTAAAAQSWISVSPTTAVIAPGEFAEVTVALNGSADLLTAGTRETLITFTDTTHGFVETREVDLFLENKQMTARWRFDETSGTTATDASGNGHNGTLEGGFDFATASAPGMIGTALDFDGDDDIVNAGAVPIQGRFSIAAWVYPQNIADQAGFAYKWNDGDRTFWFGQHATDGVVRFGIWPTIFQRGVNTSAILENNTWHHLVATYDGHYPKIYLNGVLTATGNDENAMLKAKAGDLIIGRQDNANNFDGYLDDMRIYNYALTEEDIHAIICPGDLNGDNTINSQDVMESYGIWHLPGQLPDVNDDSQNNILDILALMGSPGACPFSK